MAIGIPTVSECGELTQLESATPIAIAGNHPIRPFTCNEDVHKAKYTAESLPLDRGGLIPLVRSAQRRKLCGRGQSAGVSNPCSQPLSPSRRRLQISDCRTD